MGRTLSATLAYGIYVDRYEYQSCINIDFDKYEIIYDLEYFYKDVFNLDVPFNIEDDWGEGSDVVFIYCKSSNAHEYESKGLSTDELKKKIELTEKIKLEEEKIIKLLGYIGLEHKEFKWYINAWYN